MDQNTCMDADDGSDSDESRELIDLNCYTQPEDLEGEDSDTLPTPTRHATFDNTSSSTSEARRKRPRANKSPTKKPRNKSRFAGSTDEITATMKSLRETLAATAPPQMPQLTDPHSLLWQKLEAIPITPDQRVLIGEHLSTKENKGKRGWLCNASADTLNAWVFKFLCDREGFNL